MTAHEEIVAAMQGDEMLAKHTLLQTWLSGSSTEVFPITLWAREVEVQLNSANRIYDKCIQRILAKYKHLFKDGYFCKHDGSCPATLVFCYTDETMQRLQEHR